MKLCLSFLKVSRFPEQTLILQSFKLSHSPLWQCWWRAEFLRCVSNRKWTLFNCKYIRFNNVKATNDFLPKNDATSITIDNIATSRTLQLLKQYIFSFDEGTFCKGPIKDPVELSFALFHCLLLNFRKKTRKLLLQNPQPQNYSERRVSIPLLPAVKCQPAQLIPQMMKRLSFEIPLLFGT